MEAFFTGFFHLIGNFFRGKSCSSVCPSPWDLICFVKNLCVANLAIVAVVLLVLYVFLFFINVLHKVGFCHCIFHGLCRVLWSLVSCWSHIFGHCFNLCYDILHTKRVRRGRRREDDVEGYSDGGGSFSYQRSKGECRREERVRKSLRARSHRVRVGVKKKHHGSGSGLDRHEGVGVGLSHGIRVSRESKFVRKGLSKSNSRARVLKIACNEY
ncbi:unnamed protein product [Cochlearia groenlandica]